MKNLLKKLSCLMVVAFVAVSLFSCALTPQTTLEFTAFPETEYQAGEVSKEEFLNSVTVKLNGKDYTLTQLEILGAVVAGVELNNPGTYTLVVNYEGTSIIFEYDVVGKHQASVNDVKYESLVEALAVANAASEQVTIKLLKNVDLNGGTLKIENNANIKLDLNGYALYTLNEVQGAACLIENKGKLEVIGSGSITFLAKYPDVNWGEGQANLYPTYATNTISNRGQLVIDGNVTIENQTQVGGAVYAIDNYAGSSLTLNNGIVKKAVRGAAIRLFGGTTNLTVNGGEISGATAVWIQLPGGSFSNTPDMNITINGGKLISIKEQGDLMYTYTFGDSHADVKIDINGGEFLGGYVSIGSGTHKDDVPQLNINGGTFEYDVLQWLAGDEYKVLYKANK
ncbi:MAG: hypothetical protein IKT40_08730 [Bacilli bacterium]|nr:hypothetical protein [Bacilli bacterium]